MKAKLQAITETVEQAQEHKQGRTCLVAVTTGRDRGIYAISPKGEASYIQPLPKRLR